MKEQVAFSPREFAALFKKEQSWGYRQIYAGKVTTITEYGRIMIPASEVERILASAGRYEGIKKKPARTKKELETLAPELRTAWREFIKSQRMREVKGEARKATIPKSATTDRDRRRAALRRLTDKGEFPR